jgi:hypothetical protein
MPKDGVKTRARESGPKLLAALERLLSFPQYQDSTEPTLYAAIRHAQKVVSHVRGPPSGRAHSVQRPRQRS